MSWADTGSTDDRAPSGTLVPGDPAATTVADMAGSLRDGIRGLVHPRLGGGRCRQCLTVAVSTPDESNYPADRSALRTSPPDLRVPSLAHA